MGRFIEDFWFRRSVVRSRGFHPCDEGSIPFGTIQTDDGSG